MSYESAERVRDAQGRQYHLGVAPGEVADSVLLVGDPARARRAAELFDSIDGTRENREFVSITGRHRGLPVTVIATGIGPDNMEIAFVELAQCVEPAAVIRCGTCGALQPEIELGDLVISQAAYRLENTSTHFVGEGYPASADPWVTLALVKAAQDRGVRYHLGITATAPGFYGAQGRHVPGFPPRHEGLIDDLARQGCRNLEMEVSCLLSLASLRGVRAGAVCTAFASRPRNAFIEPERKEAAELECLEVGLGALHVIVAMDSARGGQPHWVPEMG